MTGMFGRPGGRLLTPTVVVVFVADEATDLAEGDCGRRTVAEVRDVADDFARACVVDRGDCSLAVEAVEV